MRAETITLTLARDVPPGGRVTDTEKALLDELAVLVEATGREVVEEPTPYKAGLHGQYRKMRDDEGTNQYTEVRVRAQVRA